MQSNGESQKATPAPTQAIVLADHAVGAKVENTNEQLRAAILEANRTVQVKVSRLGALREQFMRTEAALVNELGVDRKALSGLVLKAGECVGIDMADDSQRWEYDLSAHQFRRVR